MKATTLYRFFDQADDLLYVGVSLRPRHRIGEHMAEKDWWPEVRSMTFKVFDDRETAEQAEAFAIADESPRYNVRCPPVPADHLPAAIGLEGDPDLSPLPAWSTVLRWADLGQDDEVIHTTWMVMACWVNTDPRYRSRLRPSHHGPFGGMICDLADP